MKAQWNEGDERMLLGDNESGGAVMTRTIRLLCAVFWSSTRLSFIHIYNWPHVYSVPACANFYLHQTFRNVKNCASREVSTVGNTRLSEILDSNSGIAEDSDLWVVMQCRGCVDVLRQASICNGCGVQQDHESTTFLRNANPVTQNHIPEVLNPIKQAIRSGAATGLMGFKQLSRCPAKFDSGRDIPCSSKS